MPAHPRPAKTASSLSRYNPPIMASISVAICCANAADTLAAACESVAWADELVIVDSGSTDQTAEIAQQYADRYLLEPWRGYDRQKKFAAEQCAHDWVLILDSDEECTPQLADAWRSLTDEELDTFDVFLMRRWNYVMGRRVRAWQPDYQSRLIHRKRCTWPEEALHERREPSHPSRMRKLPGALLHKRVSQAGFADYFSGKRLDGRLLMVAQTMHDKGKRCRWWDLILRPQVAFWKSLIIKRGILDGAFGLLIAQKSAVSTQLKYAALWAVQNNLATSDTKSGNNSSHDSLSEPRP